MGLFSRDSHANVKMPDGIEWDMLGNAIQGFQYTVRYNDKQIYKGNSVEDAAKASRDAKNEK